MLSQNHIETRILKAVTQRLRCRESALNGLTILAFRPSSLKDEDLDPWLRSLGALRELGVRILLVGPGSIHPQEQAVTEEAHSLESVRSIASRSWSFGRLRARLRLRRFLEGMTRMYGARLIITPQRGIGFLERWAKRMRLPVLGTKPPSNRPQRPVRIAFMGIRGVPASYSGFETFAEELGRRLADDEYEVTVYNRKGHVTYREPVYRGMHMVYLPCVSNKHLETLSHTLLSIFHSWTRRFDVIYICGVGNAPLALLARFLGRHVVLNVDGADWQRAKWSRFAKFYLRSCEHLASWTVNTLIADSRAVQSAYRETYGVPSFMVTYGGGIEKSERRDVLEQFGLSEREYILFVGRMVPENNAHQLLEAYRQLETDKRLVIVGDAPYSEDYKKELRSMAGPNVVFTGYQFGDAYRQLSSHAWVYVLASEVGGTHPVLVEQMGVGNCIVANDKASNAEVLADSGLLYDGDIGADDLALKLHVLLKDPAAVESYRTLARSRARKRYSWTAVHRAYDGLFRRLCGRPPQLVVEREEAKGDPGKLLVSSSSG